MTYGLEMKTAYSYFGTSQTGQLLTYLDTNPLIYSSGNNMRQKSTEITILYTRDAKKNYYVIKLTKHNIFLYHLAMSSQNEICRQENEKF